MTEPLDRHVEEVEARFAFHRRAELEAEARDMELGVELRETFRDFLLGLPPGLVVGVVTVDGAEIWGRIEAVGADKLRLAETPRAPAGAERAEARRRHDIRFEAVSRVVRDAEEWRR